MTRRFVGAMGAAATALVLLAGCDGPASPTAAPGPERSVPSPPSSRSGETDLSALESYAREYFPDVFAGIAVEKGGVIAVYRVPPAPEFDAAIGEELGRTPFVLRDAARSERELQSITRQVLDDVDYWLAQGIEIHAVGPDIVRGVVEVLTPQADSALAPLRARYGEAIAVRKGAIVPASKGAVPASKGGMSPASKGGMSPASSGG